MIIKINKPTGEFKVGQEIEVADNKGIPTSQYWRRRLADSKIDKCISIVKPQAKARKAAAKSIVKSGESK